jgi:outer membrane lipoprotein-sorting protein
MHLKIYTTLLCLGGALCAGAAPTVDEVLAKMDAAAPKFNGMSASLSRVTYTSVLDEKSTETGKILLRKRGKDLQVRIDFTKPDPKIVAFRNRKAEIFLPKLNTVQEYDLGKQGDLVDQFLLVGFGTSGRDLKSGYEIKSAGEETIGNQKTWKLELTPTNAKVTDKLRRLELWIDQTGIYPVQQKFLEPSGDYYLFTYSEVKLNPDLSDDDLKLKLPKGVKRETPQK